MDYKTRLFTWATLASLTIVALFATLVFAPLGIVLLAFVLFLYYGTWEKYRVTRSQRERAERHAQLVRRSKGDRR